MIFFSLLRRRSVVVFVAVAVAASVAPPTKALINCALVYFMAP